MDFSIITPSFRSSKWLKLCIASVADQQGASFEHIVQDSCSDDGTQDWLPQDKRVKAFIEKDQGMYDAANRGFRRASGDILAYLNCDEQLLPGALQAVKKFAGAHPEADVILTDSVVTDASGAYLCHRLSLAPIESEMWIRFPVLSCGLFVRRRVLHDMGLFVDTQWRDLGDFF
jgi:glycosyltransferase involved in cell wall biosynthesis